MSKKSNKKFLVITKQDKIILRRLILGTIFVAITIIIALGM